MPQDRHGIGGAALVLGLFAICCGGPLLLATLAATGLGGWLLAAGTPLLAVLAFVVAASVGALWLRRHGWRSESAEDPDCCAAADRSVKGATR